MPRRKSPPRLYLDPARKQWIIRDGPRFIRTRCAESDRSEAEKFLGRYLAAKYTPQPSGDPLIADVLNVYASEHLPHTREAKNATYHIEKLAAFWGEKKISAINARGCREFADLHRRSARRYLETFRAAINYWNREYGPLASIPVLAMPPRVSPRQRWLSRSEAARLLAATRIQHLRRFILIGLYTGSRSGNILGLQWDQIDLQKGYMARTRPEMPAHEKKRAPLVRINNRLLSHLRRWKRLDAGTVSYLCHYNGTPVRKLRRSWRAAVERAGIEWATPHSLRHTRATWLMQAGVPIWEAAGALGMTVEMLERTYSHHHPDWQKRAADV